MAGPLHWFRKNQKLLLGVAGVGLMIVFTISSASSVDPLVDRLTGGGSGGARDPVVVQWEGGELRESEVEQLRIGRNLLRRFLLTVQQIASERGGVQRVSMLPVYSADRSLLELKILAAEADKLGVEVGDEAVVDYLNQLADGTVVPSEYGQLLRSSTQANLSESQLFALMARELKAQKVRDMVHRGGYPSSPIAAWDYYNRLNRLVKAEMVPISVDDYLDQVEGEPTEAEVVELYEKYKDRYPFPLSPEPGFRRREKRAFEYVKVDYDAILAAEVAKVTDEEVAKYYGENKEEFRKESPDALDLEVDDATKASQDDDAVKAELSDDESTNTDAEANGSKVQFDTDDKPAPRASDDDPTSTTETSESAVDPEEAAPPASPPAPTTPPADPDPSPTALPQEGPDTADDGAGQDATDEQKDKDAVDEKTDNVDAGNAAADKETPAESANETDSTQTRDGATSDETAADDLATEETGGEVPPAAVEPPTKENEAAKAKGSSEDTAAGTATASESDAAPAGSVLEPSDLDPVAVENPYETLEDVADEIRQSIARPRAQAKMNEIIGEVKRKLDIYHQDYTLWEIDTETNPDAKKPSPPDVAALADGEQVVVGEVPLSDALQVEDFELGRAFDLQFTQQGGIQRIMFADTAFSDKTSLYNPQVVPDIDVAINRFVYWMTDSEEERVPKLEEVRAEVVQAYKRQRALEFALEDAKKLAEKARQPDTKFSEAFSDRENTEFIDTGEISWATAPMMEGSEPQITVIPGAEDAGPELREKLFRLQPGEVDYAANMPKNKVYIFRIDAVSPDTAQLREQFLRNGVDQPVLLLARRDSRIGLSEWYRDLTDKYGIDWKREPRDDQGSRL